MIKYSLKKLTGEKIEIFLPVNASEIKLSQVIDFEFKISELAENKNIESLEYVKGLADLLSGFLNVDFLELDIYNENESLINSMIHLQNQIWDVIVNAKPELKIENENSFSYNGINYLFPTIWKNETLQKIGYNSINLKQGIEILQVRHNFEKSVKDLANKNTLPNFLFSKALSEIAILLLKEGEEIPVSEDIFEKWLSNRISEFIDIDYQTALNINHWIESYMTSLRDDIENFYFFDSDEKTNSEDAKHEMISRHKNKAIFDKIGYKSIIQRVAEHFSSIQEALSSKFSDAVKLISITNSKQ